MPFRFQTASPTRLLSQLYLSTIIMVASLTVGGQILTQQSLSRQAQDARVINIAGKQRMLSQKIAKSANAFHAELQRSRRQSSSRINSQINSQDDRTSFLEVNTSPALLELRETLLMLRSAHEGLQSGDNNLGLPGNNSEKVSRLFNQIEADYTALTEAADGLLQHIPSNPYALVATVDRHEDSFLQQMNGIVEQYEQEATGRIRRLQNIQRLLLGLTLCSLLPMLLPIRWVTRRVDEMLSKMQESGLQVRSSSFQLAASGRQLEATVTEQAATSTQITASSQEIAATATKLDKRVAELLLQAEETMQAVSSGEQELSELAKTMRSLENMMQTVSQRFSMVSDRAHTIDKVVVAITKVADQTNLLSLNAAIEAEKAGEYGAGFSVVAREVRRLADQTELSTLEIETLVTEMQSAVSQGVIEMNEFARRVSDGSKRTQLAIEQISSISRQTKSLLPALSQISEGMDLQCMSAQQIRDALAQHSDGAQQTVRALQDSNQALERLHETAGGLQQ